MQITINDDTFGKNLLFLRKKYRLSRLALAKLMGTAQVLIAAWEECRVYPVLSPERVARLCTIFMIDSQTLLHTNLQE